MAERRPSAEPETAGAAAGIVASDGQPGSVVRRAPFADNPYVGARGQRTQQRILDAALRVFGELGYHQSGIARITKAAGCSRASFYQYFSSKEDVFRHLAGQVARQLTASAEALDPLTPDADGWASLRAWMGRHGDIYDRYQPVFKVFWAAAESDEVLLAGSARASDRNVAVVRSKLVTATLPPRQLDPVLKLLMECQTRTQDTAESLRLAAPDAYPRERVEDAVTDVVHRALFGRIDDVNVHPPARRRPPVLKLGPVMREALQRDDDVMPDLTAAGRRTLEALLKAGRDVLVTRGYHATRVDDVVTAAGVSHGAFYRYFKSKDHLALVLAGRAMRAVSLAFVEVPDGAASDGRVGRAALRRWLRRYNESQATEAAMIRVWADAAVQDPALGPDSAAVLDWGRRRMAQFLEPRGFGDPDTEAVVLLSMLSAFGTRERPATSIEAAAHVVERGLLGR